MDATGQACVADACFARTKDLQVAVGILFATYQRSHVSSSNSGSRQKIYLCAGHKTGCKAEVRAYKVKGTGEWRVHKVSTDHTGCSGGNTTGRSAALAGIARQALNDNPQLQGISLKRKIERDVGIKTTHRSATRMKNAAKKQGEAAVLESYQQLRSLCEKLEATCPGTVAQVEVRHNM